MVELGIGIQEEQVNIEWKTSDWKYVTGETAYLGKWAVGTVIWDGMVSRGEELFWKVCITLPRIQIARTHFKEKEQAKRYLSMAIRYWFKNAGMPFPIKRRKRVIGIIGTRRRDTDYDYRIVENEFLRHYNKGDVICSGLCPSGGDRFAVLLSEKYRTDTIWHKADWETNGKAAGFIRNTFIAEDSQILIACVAHDRKGGTEDTLKKFKKLGKRNWYIV